MPTADIPYMLIYQFLYSDQNVQTMQFDSNQYLLLMNLECHSIRRPNHNATQCNAGSCYVYQ